MYTKFEIQHPKVVTYAILIGQGLANSKQDRFRYLQKDFENVQKLIQLQNQQVLNFNLVVN